MNTEFSIFSELKQYQTKWQEVSRRKFNSTELAAIKEAKVVPSQFGLSVQFMMVGCGMTFIPLSEHSSAFPGDIVDMTKAELVTLSKPGEKDIIRVLV